MINIVIAISDQKYNTGIRYIFKVNTGIPVLKKRPLRKLINLKKRCLLFFHILINTSIKNPTLNKNI